MCICTYVHIYISMYYICTYAHMYTIMYTHNACTHIYRGLFLARQNTDTPAIHECSSWENDGLSSCVRPLVASSRFTVLGAVCVCVRVYVCVCVRERER